LPNRAALKHEVSSEVKRHRYTPITQLSWLQKIHLQVYTQLSLLQKMHLQVYLLYGRCAKSWRDPSQADRCLGQSNAEKSLFVRPGLSTFWRNDNSQDSWVACCTLSGAASVYFHSSRVQYMRSDEVYLKQTQMFAAVFASSTCGKLKTHEARSIL